MQIVFNGWLFVYENKFAFVNVIQNTCSIVSTILLSRCVDSMLISEVTSFTTRYPPTPPWQHKGQSHGHECSTHTLFVPCQSALPFLRLGYLKPTSSEIKIFQNGTLKNSRSMSWLKLKVNATWLTQYPTNALPFHYKPSGSNIPHIW